MHVPEARGRQTSQMPNLDDRSNIACFAKRSVHAAVAREQWTRGLHKATDQPDLSPNAQAGAPIGAEIQQIAGEKLPRPKTTN